MDLLERVRTTGLLAPDTAVVVLLSGGRDSVCLLDCAARLAPTSALHVNYGLRDHAAADEAHCRSLCARLGVELTVERVQRPDGAGNVQAWARDVRYAVGGRAAAFAVRCCRRWSRSIPRRSATSSARLRCCVTRRMCSTRWSPSFSMPTAECKPTAAIASGSLIFGCYRLRLGGSSSGVLQSAP